MTNLKEKLKNLPDKPGVYIMYDADGHILYIGKAKVLKNRVRQYFHDSGSKTAKLIALVSKINDLSYIITSGETDALALEANLIRKHKPPYNILLKDDKAKPYIKIDLREEYPAPTITRTLKNDGAKYFGPFWGVSAKELIELIQSAYLVKTCGNKKFPKSHRECLNYHIGLCSAPCTRRITPAQYRKQINKVMAFLSGKDENLESVLKEKMFKAADEERFEAAIHYRQKLEILKRLRERLVTTLPKIADIDIIGYAQNPSYIVFSVLNIRAGKMSGAQNFSVPNTGESFDDLMTMFLAQYYDGTKTLPAELILPSVPEGIEGVCQWLAQKYGHTAKITVPKKGAKKKLADTARLNAEDYLETNTDREKIKEDMTSGAVDGLQKLLGLSRRPRRMECYDISGISGTDKVASMVVFVEGQPQKSLYRRFKIKTVEGSDDFASIYEAISRRAERIKNNDTKFGEIPDLIVIDGGKGQLSAAHQALCERGLDIDLISLAKREEEVFKAGQSEAVRLPYDGWELKLLQRIRDEAHRFALAYHRSLRQKNFESRLLNIEGVGRVRAKALFDTFQTIEAIMAASEEELQKTPGISKETAAKIYQFFHSEAE